MTRHILSSLLLLVLTMGVKAQYKDYDLNRYINPDYQRKSLDINFNSSGQFYKNTTTTNNNLNGTLAFSYNKTRLSRKVQETFNIGMGDKCQSGEV